MADEIDLGASPENGFGDEPMPQVAIITQYVKDLSFENPNAPNSLQLQAQPRIDVNVGVNARKVADNVYEVELKIEGKADAGATVLFAFDLVYAGVFRIQNVPQNDVHPIVMIECPRLLFPFAREIVAAAVRNGGFPPLMIDPIDFAQMFAQRVSEEQSRAKGQGAPN